MTLFRIDTLETLNPTPRGLITIDKGLGKFNLKATVIELKLYDWDRSFLMLGTGAD